MLSNEFRTEDQSIMVVHSSRQLVRGVMERLKRGQQPRPLALGRSYVVDDLLFCAALAEPDQTLISAPVRFQAALQASMTECQDMGILCIW